MINAFKYSRFQLTMLVVLRLLIGWHLLFEGISKVLNPMWSSAMFLSESQWLLSEFANWMVSNQEILTIINFLNTWGLIAIGLGLILGLFSSIASVAGAILILLYYFNSAPITGIEYSMPSEGNYMIVNKTLIEAIALGILIAFPTSKIVGLDSIVFRLLANRTKCHG